MVATQGSGFIADMSRIICISIKLLSLIHILMNQYSQEDAAKTAGISGSLILNPLPGLDVAAVAGLDFLLDEDVYKRQQWKKPELKRVTKLM